MPKLKTATRIVACLLALGFVVACDGDDDPVGLDPPDHEIAGTWSCTEVAYEIDCGEGTNTYVYDVVFEQDGNELEVVMDGRDFDGSISGSTVRWTGSFPEDGGITTITQMNLTVHGTGTEMTGSMAWRWADDAESCTGSSELVLVKVDD